MTQNDELRVSRVIYLETMPKLRQNIDIGDGVRAVVERIEGDDVISVFAATPGLPMGENLKLRVIELTPEQRAFVDLVRNAMITGALHAIEKLDKVRRVSATCDSAHDVLARVLSNAPIDFIAFRPFEVTEIMAKLGLPTNS